MKLIAATKRKFLSTVRNAQCEQEGANEHQIEESKKAVANMEVIIGDPDRLRAVAQDFIDHYENRVAEGATVAGKPIRTGYILSLCPKCRAEFFSVPENILRRVDPLQVEKEPCDKCQVGYGYDYLITKRTKRLNNGGGGLDV